ARVGKSGQLAASEGTSGRSFAFCADTSYSFSTPRCSPPPASPASPLLASRIPRDGCPDERSPCLSAPYPEAAAGLFSLRIVRTDGWPGCGGERLVGRPWLPCHYPAPTRRIARRRPGGCARTSPAAAPAAGGIRQGGPQRGLFR